MLNLNPIKTSHFILSVESRGATGNLFAGADLLTGSKLPVPPHAIFAMLRSVKSNLRLIIPEINSSTSTHKYKCVEVLVFF